MIQQTFRRTYVKIICLLTSQISLVLPAVGGENKLEPTAHPNVMRTFSPTSGSVTQNKASATSGGMVVYLDENGRPTQNPQKTRDAVQIPEANFSHKGLVTRTETHGGKEVNITDLQGRFQSYAVGVIGPDGKPRTGCVTPGDIKAATSNTSQTISR